MSKPSFLILLITIQLLVHPASAAIEPWVGLIIEARPDNHLVDDGDRLEKASHTTGKPFIVTQRGYAIKLGAFKNENNAKRLRDKIQPILPELPDNTILGIVNEEDFYKVRIYIFGERAEVNRAIDILYNYEIIDYQLIPVRENQQQIIFDEYKSGGSEGERRAGRTRISVDYQASPVDTTGERQVSLVREIIDRIFYALQGDLTKVPFQREDDYLFPGFRPMVSGDTIPGSEGIFDVYNPWLRRFDYFGKSLTLVATLIIVIVVSVSTMIVLLVIILLNRIRMERRARLNQYLLENYQKLIINYLYGEADPEMFKSIASDRYRRQVLINQMQDVAVNLKGGSWEKLRALYLDLGLDHDSVRKAYARRWHIKVKGFRELAFMNIKDANEEILKCLNSHNEILRMEAQIALVRLSDDNPFEFLYHLKRTFSLWEQISLHELIVQHNIKVPLFSQWIDSPNDTIVMFALRMIREFKQTETEDAVKRALAHPNEEVRELAIQVAGDLKMKKTLPILKRMYKNEEYGNSLEILKSMGKMPDESYLGFLKLVLDKEDDVQLQIEATKAIENMGEPGIKELVKLMKSEYKNYNIIIRHVLDRRIY